ncbi:MAG: aldehyde dehydrogenase family protein [Deltaproteobacteria bacterium]|nr:aldehyde dehydrogenase family protein [Deltaproteobacteria bacterium]
MAYLIRRLMENTSNTSFLRQTYGEKEAIDKLILPPAPKKARISSRASARKKITADAVEPFHNEPLLDFSRAENRARFAEALNAVREKFGGEYPLWIGADEVETNRWLQSANPAAPSEILGRAAVAGPKEAERAVGAALEFLPQWRDTAAEKRAGILFRARTTQQLPGESNVYFYEPRGIAAVIAPWNFPLAILTGMTAAALAAGNCAVIKPAEQSPLMGALLMEILREAELPPVACQMLQGGGELGALLVRDPRVHLIAFTGSRDVGLEILRAAYDNRPGQDHVKRVVCEMGGKNAIVVDEDADLDEAVTAIVESAFGYQGQKCSAASRIILIREVHDLLLDRLAEAVRSLKIGPPEDPRNFIGPVIDAAAQAKIREYIDLGKTEGKCALEREAPGEGFFVGPVIFRHIEPHHRLANEEIFGPVLSVIKARDFDHALEIANRSSFALTGGVFSRSPAHIEKARKEFRVGNLYINRGITGAIVERQPFGGLKLSGIGSKAGGPDYLLQFLEPRTISENTLRHGFVPPEELEVD